MVLALEQFLKVLGRINNTPSKVRMQDAALPDWVMGIADAVIQFYRALPKDPGTGRPLPPETYNASFAAGIASEYHKDQKAPERFLKNWLGIHETDPERLADLLQALLEELRRQWEKPFDDPELWVLDGKRCLAYLRSVVPQEATRIKDRREMADKEWGLRRKWVKNLPPDPCEFVPEAHGKTEDDPAQELAEFQLQENAQLMLRQLEDILPERQYQAILLKAEELTDEEVATRMGITIGAVKQHLHRARNNPELKKVAGSWVY